MDNWIELNEDNIPEPFQLVWVQRKGIGNIYLASRREMPLATNPDTDTSRDCHWWGNPVESALTTNNLNDIHPKHNFSDVSVARWQPVQIPSR